MKLPEIDASLDVYEGLFENFVRQYDIPREFLRAPDHLAIKCADEMDYIETCHELSGVLAGSLWELQEGGRLLASGWLADRVVMSGYGFGMIEIMQPKPGKETEEGYVEHVEFTYPDLFIASARLFTNAVDGVEEQSNPGHSWLNIPISSDGLLEIKLNDRALKDVVDMELLEGKLTERVV